MYSIRHVWTSNHLKTPEYRSRFRNILTVTDTIPSQWVITIRHSTEEDHTGTEIFLMANTTFNSSQKNLFLNSAIGFLGLLLLVLIIALGTRLVYPRIVSDRADADPALISSIIQIEILNGCGIPGLASKYTGTLRSYGFDVVETGNFDHFNIEKSLVISRSGHMENVRRVAKAIGIPEEQILREESPDYYLDVTLVIGSDHELLNL